MGYVEDLWERRDGTPTDRYGKGKRYRAVPWFAGAPGMRGRRGPTETFDEFRAAELYVAKVEQADDVAIADAGLAPSRRTVRPTFAEYVVEVAATMGAAKATRQSYASMARTLAEEWPTADLDDLTADDVDGYFARLVAEGKSASLRAKRRTVITETYRRGMRAGLVKSDPTADVRPVNQRKRRKKRPVTEKEFGYIVKETPAWLRAGMYLAYDAGMRPGEICGLHWADVDLDKGIVWIGPVMENDGTIKPVPKNGEPEELPLTPRTVEALRDHAERFPGGPTDLVIREPRTDWGPNPDGRQPLWPPRYRDLFLRACRLASLDAPYPRAYDLRHGHAERLAEAGVPIHVLQRLMRHRDVKSTQQYFPEVSLADMRRAFDQRTAADRADGQPPTLRAV